ncbi:MAG: molybdopterin cofactor-binding domain-containing protein [Chloroflexota bacterium]
MADRRARLEPMPADVTAEVVRLTVNGRPATIRAAGDRSLLSWLRDDLGLSGTKPACGEGVCGACTVLVDGAPVRSCVTRLAALHDGAITTIEGIGGEDALSALQSAFIEERAFQCGYCTPGMIVGAAALLGRNSSPDDAEIAAVLDGHICRCGTYRRVMRAVHRAAESQPGTLAIDGAQAAIAQPLIDAADAPWDLLAAGDQDWFSALGDGLVAVLPPPGQDSAWAAAWTTSGGIWLHVGADGIVTAFTGKMEMGQDNSTALATIVADAVAVERAAVRMVMADTDVCPYDEGTFGSRSIPDAGAMLRAAGRTALRGLLKLASDRLEVSTRDLVAGGGAIATRDGARTLDYATLLRGVRKVERVRGGPARAEGVGSNLVGTSRIPGAAVAIVTGRRTYATDVDRPGIRHGWSLEPPVRAARLRSVDVTEARDVPGVTLVEEGDFIGLVASDNATLERAVAAIRAEWDVPRGPGEGGLAAHLRANPVDVDGWDGAYEDAEGDVDAAVARASATVRATYTVAYVAHVPLETRAAVAEWNGERVTVWTGTQTPFEARSLLADALDIDEARVRVIVPPAGAGFGGKHGAGAGIAAARLSRAVGAPVKVRWRHADEIGRGHVRPAAVIDVVAAATTDGTIEALDFLNINSGPSGIEPPYSIPNRRIRYQPAAGPLEQGAYRGLAATANAFARESAIDELAHAAGIDPLELRITNADDERLVAVLRAAAERAGWTAPRPTGHGVGIACAFEKDSYVATAAEVTVNADGKVRLVRFTTAFDCGAIVDPENLANQVEGAAVMALGPAMFEQVHFDGPRITNAALSSYRVPRFTDVPPIEVVLLDRPREPSRGGGEVPLIAVAPAIANAIFAASGRRLRSMPLVPDPAPY